MTKKVTEIFDVVPVKETILSNDVTDDTEFLEAEEVESSRPIIELNADLDNDLRTDYGDSRKNLASIIQKGLTAIDEILAVAKESEHPRAYEVAATMIKNVTEANEKLITLQKQMREMTNHQAQDITVEKAIFVGSTKDLLRAIRDKTAQ